MFQNLIKMGNPSVFYFLTFPCVSLAGIRYSSIRYQVLADLHYQVSGNIRPSSIRYQIPAYLHYPVSGTITPSPPALLTTAPPLPQSLPYPAYPSTFHTNPDNFSPLYVFGKPLCESERAVLALWWTPQTGLYGLGGLGGLGVAWETKLGQHWSVGA